MTRRKARSKAKKQSKSPKQSKAQTVGAIQEIMDLKAEGDRLHQAYEHPEAVEAYTRALELGHEQKDGLDPALEFDLHKGRAECFGYLGDVHSEVADLEAMAALAEAMDDLGLRIQVVALRQDAFNELGRSEEDVRAATSLVEGARTTSDRALLADSLCALGWAYTGVEDAPNCELYLGQALEIYRELGNLRGEAMCLIGMGQADAFVGRVEQALENFAQALGTFRSLGDRRWESRALSSMAINMRDQSDRRAYYESDIALSSAIGDRVGELRTHNNLAMLYYDLGLYDTARRYIEPAIQTVREMGYRNRLATFVETLGRILLDLGELDQARAAYQEMLDIALELKQKWAEGYALLGLGLTQLKSGLPEDSLAHFQSAREKFRANNNTPELAAALSYVGSAQLALGDRTAALESTRQAVKFLHEAENKSTNFPPHFIWWIRHRALKASEESNNRGASGANGSDGGDGAVGGSMGDQAWDALQRAYEFTLAGIENLSDQGLRRSYLNKVEINREIVIRRNEEAMARGLPPADESPRTGNLQEQLKRMLAIGLQLNERRTADELTQFIMSQFVELSGAERSALILTDETGDRQLAAERGFSKEGKPAFLNQLSILLDDVAASQHTVLKQNVSPDNMSEPSSGFMDAVSVLCVPLIAHDQLLGMLYGDNHAVFGRFGEADVDLLSAFANQAASAIENARLYQGLEDRVAERTAELNQANAHLEQRAAELSVINSVQEGLASKLDFQAIIELVGQKIMQVFKSEGIGIRVYDPETDLVHYPFEVENGERLPAYPPQAAIGVSGHIIRTRQPLMLNEDLDQWLEEHGATILPGSERNKSCLGVPVVVKDEVRGLVLLENARENAYTEADQRLLSTIAASMGVALENARLFDETTRLLEETRHRNAELAVINSVGEALAAKLEIQGIYDAVGDKLHEVFPDSQVVDILSYDSAENLFIPHYVLEKGKRYEVEPWRARGFRAHVVETGQPLVINEDMEGKMKEYDNPVIVGETAKSWVGVPMKVGEQVIGVISLQHIDEENAFSDSDVSLLQTLASSMSVALENARLFEETNRLLDETRQRNAELAVINSVQEGLANQLEMQAIFDLLGDTIQEVFDAQTVMIVMAEGDQYRYPYIIEKGERLHQDPTPSSPGKGFGAHTMQTLQPLMINEGMEEKADEYGSSIVAGGEMPKSGIYVPLVSGSQARGFISIQNIDRENAFSNSDLRLLTTLASSMSVALENARLFEETQYRAAEMTAISTVSQALVAESDLDRILELVGEQVRDIFEADIAYVAVHDEDANLITFPYMHGEDDVTSMPFGSGLTSEIIRSGEPLLLNRDIDEAAAQLNTERAGRKAASYLGVPIFVGGQAIGVVSVQSTAEEERFDEADVRLLSTIAANAGAAIGSARLYEETKQRASELAAINVIGEGLLSQMDVNRVVELVGDSISQIFEAQQIGIAICDYDAQKIHIPYFLVSGERLPSYDMDMGDGLASVVVETRQPLRLNNWEELRQHGAVVHPDFKDPLPEENSWLGVPIMSGTEVSGIIFSNASRSNAFSEADQRLLSTIAANMGVAIRNAQLYGETQRRAEEMQALNEIGREATATLDLQTVLQRISGNARKILDANTASVILLDENGKSLHPISAEGTLADEVMAFTWELGEGLVGGIVQSGKAERINDVISDPRMIELPGTQKSVEGEKLLVAPLISREAAIGAIAAWRGVTDPVFSPEDLNFVVGLAQQATIAIQNARLFEETQREKQYSEGLVLNSPVAIITTDLEARVVSWNPAAERLFGYTVDEAIGRNLDGLIAADDIHDEAVGFTAKVWDEGRVNAVTRRARKDGSLVDVELLALPVTVEGEHSGLIAIYHDITELLAAQKEAEAANQAKSAFLATMSHEIRTPMNAVIGMSGLLLDTELGDEQREFAEIIRNSGDALLGIINDVLDFSKIEAGKMELEYQPFDLRECIEGTLDLVATRAFDKGLDIAYVLEEDIPAGIVGDVTRLRQIILNLLTNAVKFTEEGEVVLTVQPGDSLEPPSDGDGSTPSASSQTLHFSVRDTGIGIPVERMDRLFQSFSQVDASTARKYGGTGLGLAISKRLSEMMGGTMWVESEMDVGTIFHFTIRAEPSSEITPATRRMEHSDPGLRDRRVLIVDDNDTNRRILTLQTQGWGMIPRDTASPKTALKWIRKGEPFDLAILDMNMPEMDGIALAGEIRQYRDTHALPLILFTSLGRREAGQDQVEFAAYLNKPIKPSHLFDTLVAIFADQPVVSRQPSRAGKRMDPEMAKRHPLRILLAEDNAVNQKLATRLLAQMGYRTDVAANGLEAIDALERQRYDIVLMDVQMPEMDGLEASRQINKQWSRDQRPQIVAMTANAMQGDRELCIAAGMDDYITKPIRVEELVAALERVPGGRRQGEDA